jgi:hypothetical protein
MLSAAAIVAKARRRWNAALLSELRGEPFFPLRIPFGRPSTTAEFLSVRSGTRGLVEAPYPWTIEWELVETRKWGRQRWPAKLAFESIETLAQALDRTDELVRFRAAVSLTRELCPALEPWLGRRGHMIVKHLDDWSDLVAVCAYFDKNPQPHCFPRQVPVGNTKFIENRTGILREMLDTILGDRVSGKSNEFAERFGLLAEPPLLRFRFLDATLRDKVRWPVDASAVPVPLLAAVPWTIPRVIVVENRDVFLSLPAWPLTLAVFGSGKAATLLSELRWLNQAEIVYWGDCDEAGFGMLSRLRVQFPRVQSILMDRDTWERWGHLAVPGKRDRSAVCDALTQTEAACLSEALRGPWMLEQERIPMAAVERALRATWENGIAV